MKKNSKKNKVYFGQDEFKNKNEDDKIKSEDSKTHSEDFSAKSIYSLLKQAGHPLRLDDILRRLDVTRRSKKEILSLLQELISAGKIVRQRGASYALSEELQNIQGRVAIQRSGAGFVIPQKANGENGVGGKSTGEDIYVPAHSLSDAWNGDLVELVILPNSTPNFRGSTQKREGRVIRVVERGQSEFVVRLEHDAPKPHLKYIQHLSAHGYIGRPTDSRFNFRVLVPANEVLQDDRSHTATAEQDMPHSLENNTASQSDKQSGKQPANQSGKQLDSPSDSPSSQKSPLREGDLVIIEVGERLPSRDDNPLWLGTALRKLGEHDKVSVQEEITKLGHGVPTNFPDDVLAEAKWIAEAEGFYYTDNDAKGLKNDIKVSLEEHDVDLRGVPLVTIDGADSRDFDDAIFVEKNGGSWRLVVAIADVSRYVLPFSKLDNEARQRGNSYYFPSSVEPMLPESLSNGLCSLRPKEDHRIMFADMTFDKNGIRQKSSFGQGLMRSKARLTYEAVQELYEKGSAKDAPFAENMDDDVNAMLLEARELANVLIERRRKAGSLHLEIPEPKCVTKNNKIVALATRVHFFAHELIEAFMVSANEAVAEFLSSKHAPCLYRVHPSPAPERMESLNVVLQGTAIADLIPTQSPQKMGANNWLSHILYKLEELKNSADKEALLDKNAKHNMGDSSVSKKNVNKRDTDNLPDDLDHLDHSDDSGEKLEASLGKNTYLTHRLILRSMMQARYSSLLEEHFGLASQCYCHFTSPIRRYADLMVHRSLKESLGITKKQSKIFSVDALVSTADLCNERERIATAAEREIYRRLACLLLESEVGKEFDAVVSGLSNFGMFAEMSSNMAEGMIRMENLGNDYFIYNEEAQTLYGQDSGCIYRLGDAIRVELMSVDLSRLEINLSLVGATPRTRKGAQNHRSNGRSENPRDKYRDKSQGESRRGSGGTDRKSAGAHTSRNTDRKFPHERSDKESLDKRNYADKRNSTKNTNYADDKERVNKERKNNSDTIKNTRANDQGDYKQSQQSNSTQNDDGKERKVHRPKKPKQRDLAKDSSYNSNNERKNKKKKDHKKTHDA